jgi:hypothetical protein
MTTLDLMTRHPGEWFAIPLDELGSLVSNPKHAHIYQIARERRFALLASWQEGRMYVRVVEPNGREQFFETTSEGGFIRSERAEFLSFLGEESRLFVAQQSQKVGPDVEKN